MFRFELLTIMLWACLLLRENCNADPVADERTAIITECAEKVNFPMDQVQVLNKRNFEEPIPAEFKCWINCIYERYGGLVNGALAPKEEVKLYLLSEDQSKNESEYEKFKTCHKQIESENVGTLCERAFKIFMCVKQAGKSG